LNEGSEGRGHVARVVDEKCVKKSCLKISRDLGVNRRINELLKWFLIKYVVKIWPALKWQTTELHKGRVFLDQTSV
jgi:hypothetical protein